MMKIQLLLRCPYCNGGFTLSNIEDYRMTRQYAPLYNVHCPHCHTCLVASKLLDVIPTSEDHKRQLEVIGRYIKIKMMTFDYRTGEPPKEVHVPRKILWATGASSYCVELPEGGQQDVHQQQIAQWMPEGWEPESLGPVVSKELV